MKLTASNVTIMVRDMDASIAFYESLGLTLRQRWEDNYAMIDGPGITLGIHPGGDGMSSSGSLSIGFMVDDHDGARALLDRLGIDYTPTDDGKSGLYCHFKDPDGTALYFVKPLWS